MSDDYTSQMIQWIMDQAAMGQPQQIPEYDLDPEDVVKDRAARMNLYQDTLNNSFDFANSAAAGPGAFAPGAFQSQSTYTPVEQGGMQALRAYAARPNTLEGIIAQGILGGSTAAAEIAKLQQAYTEAEANGTLEGSVLEQIPMSPPDDMGVVSPDWESLGFRMGDIEEAYITEAQGGTSGALFDPTTGELVGGGNRQYLLDDNGQPVLVDVDTQMSEAAQRFADQGLSLPTDQFQMEDLIDPGLIDTYSQMPGMAQQNMQAYEDWLQSHTPPYQPTAKDMLMGGQQPTWAKPGGPQAAPPPSGDAGVAGGGISPNSAAGRLQAVGDVANNLGGGYLRDLIQNSGRAAGPQTVVNNTTDLYGMPTTSSTGGTGWEGMIQSIPADVGQAGLTDINAVAGGDSVTARLIDSWLNGIGAGAGNAGNAVGGAMDSVVDWGSGLFNDDDASWVRPEDVRAEQGGTPSIASGGGNAVPGVGGAGAGGVGGPRTLDDLGGTGQQQPASTQALIQQLLSGVSIGTDVSPGLTGYERVLATTHRGQDIGAPPPTGQRITPESSVVLPPLNTTDLANIFARASNTSTRTGPEPSELAGQAQQPTLDQLISIMGQRTSRENMHDVTGDQQVRIGKKKTNDTRTNTPSGRGPGPRISMKAQHTPSAESRRLGEQYIQGYHDREAAARAAGIGTGAYGRAAAAAYLLAQQGITPLSTQQAARRAASGAYGV